MNFTRKIGFISIMLGMICLLSACDRGASFQDLQDYLAKLKAANVSTDKSDDTLKVAVPVVPTAKKYEASAHRSPFETLDTTPVKNRVITNPLQTFPIDMIRFVGTVTQDAQTQAFVAAPDNRIYQIKVGDIIGDHDDKVLTIESDKVTLLEQYSEEGATSAKRVVTLQLKEMNQ